MSPEERLLLLLARGELGETELQRVRDLAGRGVDWAAVAALARSNEVAPLVHRNVERLVGVDVPSPVREALAESRRTVAARNGLLGRELRRVLGALDEAGVPAMPMKGLPLADALYGDPGLRDCSDIDVLVPRHRAREALRLLRGSGYAAEFTETFFESLLLRGHIEYTLTRNEHGFRYVLDLHWGIGWTARGDRRAAQALWAEGRRVRRAGVEMLAMSPEWELLALAVHAARHGWEPLKWLVDVHDYCASQPVDWQRARETAERFGWLPALQQTLGACRMLFGTPAPPCVPAVAPVRWRPSLGTRASIPDALLPLRVMTRWPERVRYLLGQLLVPTLAERRLVRLPTRLRFFYYPIRPARLGGKWGWWFLQRLRRPRPMETG